MLEFQEKMILFHIKSISDHSLTTYVFHSFCEKP
jgi:hypothetical protein